jgi:nucleotide-binding universal stress UspA family protein
MALTISREQRDAIYELVLTHLTGIGDVWIQIEKRNFAKAKRLGRAFAEDLRLLDDLGWSETIDHNRVALTMAPTELAQTVARLHGNAAASLDSYVSRPKDDEEQAQRDLAASAALGELLGQIIDGQRVEGEEVSR